MDKTTIEWGKDAQWITAVKLFVAALDESPPETIRQAVTQIARHLGLLEDVIFELGERTLERRLRGAPIDTDPVATDPEGDPLDADGNDGTGDVQAEPTSNPDGKRRTCERCDHRTPLGVCHAPGGPRENEHTAVGDTCDRWALLRTPPIEAVAATGVAPAVGEQRACPKCGHSVEIQCVGGKRFKLRPHRSKPKVNCPANTEWFVADRNE